MFTVNPSVCIQVVGGWYVCLEVCQAAGGGAGGQTAGGCREGGRLAGVGDIICLK